MPGQTGDSAADDPGDHEAEVRDDASPVNDGDGGGDSDKGDETVATEAAASEIEVAARETEVAPSEIALGSDETALIPDQSAVTDTIEEPGAEEPPAAIETAVEASVADMGGEHSRTADAGVASADGTGDSSDSAQPPAEAEAEVEAEVETSVSEPLSEPSADAATVSGRDDDDDDDDESLYQQPRGSWMVEEPEEDEPEIIESGPASIAEYVAELDESIGAIVVRLAEIIRDVAPNAQERIKWGMPHYAQSGHLAYIDAKQDHVNLGFFRGDELADHEDARNLLQGAGGKLRHVRLYSVHSIAESVIRSLVAAAVELNRDISGL